MKTLAAVVLVLALSVANFARPCLCELRVGFYDGQCGETDVEATIRDVVSRKFNEDNGIVAALLRLMFHDCFVQGCDASLLLDGSSCEKTAGPNFSVRGFEIIDEAKDELEKACPGVVSCADIIVAATRDAVSFSGGKRYEIRMGRRDGLVSEAGNVVLPGPSIPLSDAIEMFGNKGFTPEELVLLLGGGHTVGTAECGFVADRLYNYRDTGGRDPNMDPNMAASLRRICLRNGTALGRVYLDQRKTSVSLVDNDYYRQLLLRRGVLEIDQALATDPRTLPTVFSLAFSIDFPQRFAEAMIKLGELEVIEAPEGEIRTSCRAVNQNQAT